MKKLFLILSLLTVSLLGLWQGWPGTGEVVTIRVSSGSSGWSVAKQLKEKGLLKSASPFLGWVKLRGAAKKIRPGRYEFKKGRSAFWIVDDLIKGKIKKVQVVIPEGFASWQIAERLEEKDLCAKEDFQMVVRKDDLEGYLFPATYHFNGGETAQELADKMVAELQNRWTEKIAARAKERGWTQKQTLTLASIIEREVRRREELPLVSALYNNRLRKGMFLGADPTVQFAKGEWVSRLTYADYRNTISPYNTYLHRGLPPGPICSPGFDAIEAALWPGQSNALYMVAKEDGYHDFSLTHREHINKVNRRNRLRRIEAANK